MSLHDTIRLTRRTSVNNKFGMHARPASKIAQMAETARSKVWINANATRVDAASTLDILSLCAVQGTDIVVEIEDQKDADILDQIVDFFETGFGEASQ